MQEHVVIMYCSTIIIIKSHYFISAAATDKSTRDRQQPMVLHCCPQSEIWCLKKICKVFGRPS